MSWRKHGLELSLLATVAAAAGSAVAETWTTEGFEAFRRGTFGNAGQNLYVSKAGCLQRIYQYDLDHNGWFDLTFANCQDFHESPPSYVYALDGTRVSVLPGKSTVGATVVDLDGDGVKDIVLAGNYDEVSPFANADVYFGARDEEYSEKYQIKLQSPRAQDCCWGRFRGETRPSLVFVLKKFEVVRIYEQTDVGFEWATFTDLPIRAELAAATDLDGDGYDDLVTRYGNETRISVFWGGKDGISLTNVTEFAELDASEVLSVAEQTILTSEMEHRDPPCRLLQALSWNGRRGFTVSTGKKVLLIASGRDRVLRRELEIEVPMVYATAAGDFDGDGLDDLAFASQVKHPDDSSRQASFIWFNSARGFLPENRRTIETSSACCIDARENQILFGQCEARRRYTNEALLYTVGRDRSLTLTRRFEGENMRRVCFVDSPGKDLRILVVNNLARSSVGYDRSCVYWGAADGYAADRRTEVPSWCAVDALAADLDDDGWAELVIGNNSENSLNLDPGNHLHHFGPNGFEPQRSQLLPTGIGWATVAGDFDRDGYLDLIMVADHWNNLRYFHGGPNGYRDYETIEVLKPLAELPTEKGALPPAGGLRWFIAVDANADGWLDLALTTCRDRQFILWGGPEGFSMARHQEVAGVMCTGVRAADLSQNGYPELIYGGHTDQANGKGVWRRPHKSFVYVFWNGPEGLRESRKSSLRADAASHLCVGDFDRNGWLDVFASSYNGEVDRDINSFIYWNRHGSFREFDRQDLITHAVSGCVALDFNEDGYLDLALANHKVFCDHRGYSEVWWNGAEGFLPTRTTKLPTFGPHGMYAIEPGNQLTRGPEEYYFSEPRVAERDLVVTAARVESEIPPKCWVKVMMRANAGEWREAVGFAAEKGDRIQYRLELGATNSLRSPRVRKVEICY